VLPQTIISDSSALEAVQQSKTPTSSASYTLHQTKIRPLLNKIALYPTLSQINEVVHCACEQAGRRPVDHVTFGEFCVLVTELQEHYRRNVHGSQPRSQLKERAVMALTERRLQRRFSGHASRFQVFLGGSCNPTTWRSDIAIPYLKQHGITFYNPQVTNWRPELMDIEDQAKQTAELLLFVIDNVTRSTASMVEAAYLAGCGRQLVLVIKQFKAPVVIYDELLQLSELEDLERSHAYLTDLVERMSIPVFSDLSVALDCTKKLSKQGLKVSDLTIEDGAQPIKFPHVRVANELFKTHDVFKTIDTLGIKKLNWSDVSLAFRALTDEDLPSISLPPSPNESSETDEQEERMFTFEEFCCLLSEFRYRRKSLVQRAWQTVYRLPSRLSAWLQGGQTYRRFDSTESTRRRDLFLGGSCGVSRWRDDTAIPILMKHGVSYYNPQLPEWNTRYIPLEAALKDSCQLLVYVITEDTRAMTSMIEAGYFIGQGCNIILCIQNMKQGICIDGEQLSPDAVNDYNRARTYLADLANRDGVPVFDKVEEAIMAAVQRLKEGKESDYYGHL